MKINITGSHSKVIDDNSSLAEQIRGKRRRIECTNQMASQTKDIFEKTGVEQVIYPQYTKFNVINTPTSSIKNEMKEVMDGFYDGKISKEEIKDFFVEYANTMYAKDDESILNLYESFLNQNYACAVSACWDEAKDIARKEGKSTDYLVYYNANFYYQSEEIHDLLKEAVIECGKKYGVEVDPEKREKNFKGDYLTGIPNFNSKWNFMAANVSCRGRLMNLEAVPPKGFSFFYKEGENLGIGNSLLIISGNDWSEKVNVPFEIPKAGRKTENYFYLADLFQINSDKEKCYNEFNSFLNTLVINRNLGDRIIINRR